MNVSKASFVCYGCLKDRLLYFMNVLKKSFVLYEPEGMDIFRMFVLKVKKTTAHF